MHATNIARSFGGGAVEQTHILPASLTGAPAGLSWDFSKTPVFPGDRTTPAQMRPRLNTPPRPGVLQPKLAIGEINDPLEHEADRVADQATRMPGAPLRLSGSVSAAAEPAAAPPIVHEVLRDPGESLDPATRSSVEPRFGFDFSGVRVHTDERAARSAAAVNARAFTVGQHVAFARDQYSPASSEGRRLLVHELSHTLQQGTALRRTPDGSPTASADVVLLAPAEDRTEKNPRIVAFAEAARKRLDGSPGTTIGVNVNWSSATAMVGTDWSEKRKQLSDAAHNKGQAVKTALAKLGIPAKSISISAADLNQDGIPPGPDGQVTLVVRDVAPILVQPFKVPPSGTTKPPAPGTPLLDLDRDADLTSNNTRIAETVRYNLAGPLRDPGGKVTVVAYVGEDPGKDARLLAQQRIWAESRAGSVRSALVSFGVEPIDIDTNVKFVPLGDKQSSHVTIAFTPKQAAAADTGVDLGKLTTFQLSTPKFSLTIKIPLPYIPVPKSIELKHKLVTANVSVPKGGSVTFKPVRGLPGVEIGLAGEITKLSDLLNPPTPTTAPGGFTQPTPGPPLKFSVSAAVNFKGFKFEASTALDLGKRTETSGLYVTLLESKVEYQVPSSVFDDLNKAGAQLQKAVSNLMGVADQQVATAPVGQPAPPAPAPPPAATASATLGYLSDVVDGMSSVLDAMDKIEKSKTTPAQAKLKIGPQLTVPFGPTRAPTPADPLGNSPSIGFGLSGTF
jgi:hypothetical protein